MTASTNSCQRGSAWLAVVTQAVPGTRFQNEWICLSEITSTAEDQKGAFVSLASRFRSTQAVHWPTPIRPLLGGPSANERGRSENGLAFQKRESDVHSIGMADIEECLARPTHYIPGNHQGSLVQNEQYARHHQNGFTSVDGKRRDRLSTQRQSVSLFGPSFACRVDCPGL